MPHLRRLIFPLLTISLLAFAACGDDGGPAAEGDPVGASSGGVPGAVPTYHADIAPLLQRSCVGCHRAGEIGGFALDNYEDARFLSVSAATAVESGVMPPFYARETAECDPPWTWADDPRLSVEEVALLRAWADAGAPEGDPSTAAPLDPWKAPVLEGVDLELTRPEPSVVDGTVDQFHCVVFDPQFPALTYVNGIHLSADNTQIAHHALTYKVKRAEVGAPGSVTECFGAPPGELVHAWAPGAPAFDLPEGVAIPVAADEAFVVQMHYHPRGTQQSDASSLQLRIADAPPSWGLRVKLVGNARNVDQGLLPGDHDEAGVEFVIPKDTADHVEQMVIPAKGLPAATPLLFVAGHMHMVGRDIRIAVERGGQEQCMLQVPTWDFSWQSFYRFDAPIDELPTISNGDRVHVRCTYDNTLGNPHLAEALDAEGEVATSDVTIGESTLEEMCLAVFGALTPL